MPPPASASRRCCWTCRRWSARSAAGCTTPACRSRPSSVARFAARADADRAASPGGGCTGPRAPCSSPTAPRSRRSTRCSPRCSAWVAARWTTGDCRRGARRAAAHGRATAAPTRRPATSRRGRPRRVRRPAPAPAALRAAGATSPSASCRCRWSPPTRRCCAPSASTRSSPTSWPQLYRLMAG